MQILHSKVGDAKQGQKPCDAADAGGREANSLSPDKAAAQLLLAPPNI